MARKTTKKPIKIGLALQGGGAYGSYTRGTLKAILEHLIIPNDHIKISAVTGTSAGAVNGALLTYALNSGSETKAIQTLDRFWDDVGSYGSWLNMMNSNSWLPFTFQKAVAGPDAWPNLPRNLVESLKFMKNFSMAGDIPKQLRAMLKRHIDDWKAVKHGPVKLFANAVKENTEHNLLEHVVFKGRRLSPDSIAASGALRDFGPHNINGVNYYDGAYMRNPCFDDIAQEDITDLLVITLHPRPDSTAPMHQDCVRDNTHGKPGYELVTQEIHHHLEHLGHDTKKKFNLHVISLDVDPGWNETSRLNTDPKWLASLEQMGYDDGLHWIQTHAKQLGVGSSFNIAAKTKKTKPYCCKKPSRHQKCQL